MTSDSRKIYLVRPEWRSTPAPKVVLLTFFLSMLVQLVPSFAASTPAYRPNAGDYSANSAVFFVQEGYGGRVAVSLQSNLIAGSTPAEINKGLPDYRWCTSTYDPDCNFSILPSGRSDLILPKCQLESDTNCIDTVMFSKDSADFSSARFVRYLEGLTIAPDARYEFPGGYTAGLWEIDNVLHNGGKGTYLVAPSAKFNFNARTKKFEIEDFMLEVIPVLFKEGEFLADRWLTREEIDAGQAQGSLGKEIVGGVRDESIPSSFRPKVRQGGIHRDKQCIHGEKNKCVVQYDFLPEVRVKASVRLSNEIGGWFKGRLDNPVVQVTQLSEKSNQVTVEANPVTVPRLQYVADYNKLTPREDALLKKWFYSGARPEPLLGGTSAEGTAVFEFIESIRDLVLDTNKGSTSFWNFGTSAEGLGSECLTDTSRVTGLVTTNAMGFQGSAPEFDGTSLNYKVVGLHYKPDGKSLELGTYDLIMRDDVAKCLYGLTNAPISATISISGSGGDQVVSTTVVNSRDGWLKLRADNFTFSEKNIKITLKQEKPVTATPTPTPTPAVTVTPTPSPTPTPTKAVITANSKKTITCSRGASVKKVVAVNPKCPKGWKKRA